MTGSGIVLGLAETAKNFVGSFTNPAERLVTIEYPEQRQTLPENSRQFPFLVFDGDDPEAGLRCVACQICEKECPPQCIYIIKSKTKKPDFVGKAQFFPAVFDIDVSVCMSCQICVEVCPFDAIKMDQEFELATPDRFAGLLFDKHRLARPNSHFQKLHPTDAAETDTRRVADVEKARLAAAKAAAAAKPAAPATSSPEAQIPVGKPPPAPPPM
ncbi:MAG TPA: 4Fe-4S dicluster domain-containing protein [Verrucomicrobiota bacterium]|nr:4Fe-4S ferredoxin [Verrucomicrobiales bacterium]HRI13057.1 4Fe-4S dicluster domain-containing protein [Verrucomicrobiota bacterium]